MRQSPAITAAQARWFRLQQHGLITPFADAPTAATAMSGVQAQIVPAAGIALANRVPGFRAADLERLIFNERSLIKTWGQRGTLHLYTSADWPLIYAAQSDMRTYWERVAQQRGEDLSVHDQLVAQVAELLQANESLGRSDLRASGLPLTEEHLSGWGGIFAVLVRRGLACHAAPRNGEARMAHRERWLPNLEWNPPTAESANSELARRYLAAYGPATLSDLAYWRGRTQAEAKRWVAALGSAVVTVPVDGIPMLALAEHVDVLTRPAPAADAWPVLLLGRFEPLLLGHRNKADLIDAAHYNRVWRPAGHIEATLLVRGRIAGAWRYDWRGNGIVITVSPFRPVAQYIRRAVERRAAAVAAHFAAPLVELIWKQPI
jgi:hypothetical protein